MINGDYCLTWFLQELNQNTQNLLRISIESEEDVKMKYVYRLLKVILLIIMIPVFFLAMIASALSMPIRFIITGNGEPIDFYCVLVDKIVKL